MLELGGKIGSSWVWKLKGTRRKVVTCLPDSNHIFVVAEEEQESISKAY